MQDLKELLIKHPSLKKEIRKILTHELLSGKITDEDFDEIINEIKPSTISHETYAKAPELRSQALQIAQNEYIKGNINEDEYNKVKMETVYPKTETLKKEPFIDIVNYKTKRRIIA